MLTVLKKINMEANLIKRQTKMANFSKKKITTLILTLIKSTVLIKKIKRATIGEKVFQKKN